MKILSVAFLLNLFVWSASTHAACSEAYGKAFINEFNTRNLNVEVYFTQLAPPGNYIVRVCNVDGCVNQNFPFDQNSFWVYHQVSNIANNDDFDITLYGPDGLVADYVNVYRGAGVRPYFNNAYLSCPDIATNITSHLIYRNNSGQRQFYRTIDGDGVWAESSHGTNNTYGASNHGAVPPSLHHIRLYHDGQGLTCLPEEVTIRACQDVECSLSYLGTVSVALSPAGWVGGNTLIFSGGQTTAQLRRTLPGPVTLGATVLSPAATSTTRCFNGATESCTLVFAEAGFVMDAPDLIANRSDGPVTMRAVKLADDGVSCAPAFTGLRTVNFWSSYETPNIGSMSVSLQGIPINISPSGTAFNLTFDSNAQASIPAIHYADAGHMRLNARFEGSGEEAGLILAGSDLFVSRPIGLAVFSSEANADCGSGDQTCSVFRRAGEDFNLTVRAVAWTHAGDTDLNDNPTTPNYRQNGISLGHGLIAPGTGTLGSIDAEQVDIGAGGEVAFAQNVSEVGVFRFTATPPQSVYFGYTVPGGESNNIGRFIPDRFVIEDILPGRLDSACNGFTYTGQTIEGYVPDEAPRFTIRALNALTPSQTTQNYTVDFIKLEAADIGLEGPVADAQQLGADGENKVLVDTWMTAGILVDNGDGTMTYTASYTDEFMYQRANALISPFEARILLQLKAIEDSDGVAAVGLPRDVETGGTEIRYGRISLENAYDSELLFLNMPMKAEYFDQGLFRRNNDDSCTEIIPPLVISDIQPDPGTGFNAGHICVVDTGGSGSSGIGCADAGTVDKQFASPPVSGEFNLWFSASGSGKTGSFTVGADVPDYLKYPWSGGIDVNPTAKATFGIFKGNSRLIYMRESVW
jgi:MSHA biogenesis protein MshQ